MSKKAKQATVRCAIYTRKSTGENLDMDFNTLDAQREACEFFIRSQKSQGWVVVEDHYDDGGFTGANMARPGLQRLIDDIDAGKVDCVVVNRVDRLSRSLLDFARLIELFDTKNVDFVSTTQQFNTSQSLGRLVLNILLSFAQFEREMISERTRDKMAAARRKGKWAGGPPVLGYRVDRQRRCLEVVPEEAEQVRVIFKLYLWLQSINLVAKRLNEMGWRTKKFVTKKGTESGGKEWKTTMVHRLLRNKLYIGKVTYKGEVYEGEHEAIVDDVLFEKVQQLLAARHRGRGEGQIRNFDNILKGLLRCRCGGYMYAAKGRSHTGVDYRYYVCKNRIHDGKKGCDHPRIAAAKIEPIIIDRVKQICSDETKRTSVTARLDERREIGSLREAKSRLEAQVNVFDKGSGRVVNAIGMLDSFDDLWAALTSEERVDLLVLLIERIEVDQPAGRIELRLRDLAAPFPPLDDAAGAEA